MAHSATSMSATMATNDTMNCLIEDGNGKIIKVVKDIKKEPSESNTATLFYTVSGGNSGSGNHNSMGAYKQMCTPNQQQFTRMQNYNRSNSNANESATYTIINTHQSGNINIRNLQHQIGHNTVKYESSDSYNRNLHSTVVKGEDRYSKYTQNINIKAKSKLHTTNSTQSPVQKKRKHEKVGKGLRHFSMKVCEKVKAKGTTTYNEVADELVNEEIQDTNSYDDANNCDHKNIRRRVYDALNVLMAMQIISKDKKEIRWIGLPSSSMEEFSEYEKANEEKRESIRQKRQQLEELLLHHISFKNLIERNKEAENKGVIPTPNSSIQLPFIIVNTHKSTKINCSVANDKSEYIFKFEDKFEMHDDAEVLKRMGLLCGLNKGNCSAENVERAKSMVPPNFEKYIDAIACGKPDSDDELDEQAQYIELANDDSSSQGGFTTANNTTTNTTIIASGVRKSYNDLDDDEEYLENSDID